MVQQMRCGMSNLVLRLLLEKRTKEAENLIKGLTTSERRELRDMCIAFEIHAPMGLYFNEEKQEHV